jgi:hypothetical protein
MYLLELGASQGDLSLVYRYDRVGPAALMDTEDLTGIIGRTVEVKRETSDDAEPISGDS